MKHRNWRFFLGLSLVAFSILLYLIHFTLFGDSQHIFIFLLGDLAFVPLEVFLVTLILRGLLEEREKSNKMASLRRYGQSILLAVLPEAVILKVRDNYPYLFSLAQRTNPLNPCAAVLIED